MKVVNFKMIFLLVPILLIFCLHLMGSNSASVSFYLFTRSNPYNEQQIHCRGDSIDNSNFDFDLPTRFVIHGWNGGYDHDMPTMVTKAWLRRGSYNVIAVDWSQARNIIYSGAKRKVPDAGKQIGTFILCLHTNYAMSLKTLHVIGFSLGAHVAGHVGKFVGNGRINTIIGLDPAGPLYHLSDSEERLAETDAKYVEVIHTNNVMGYDAPIGMSDFYVNGGMNQPNCGILSSESCSHDRAYIVYSQAIVRNNFGAVRCRDYKDAIFKRCGNNLVVRMGDLTNGDKVRGIYFVPTYRDSPYGVDIMSNF